MNTPKYASLLLGLSLVVGLAACKSSFKEECVAANDQKEMTVEGTFLRGTILMQCDEWSRRHTDFEEKGELCPLPLFAKEGGEKPSIDVYFRVGEAAAQLKPMPESFDWHEHIHVVTDQGDAQLGDTVKVTGKMSVRYGGCNMLASKVQLIDDKYGPTAD
jgi:hypothetical protein